MLRVLPYLLMLALWIYCVVDALQADESRVRALPKVAWVFLVVLFPVLGSLCWLALGRPQSRADSSHGTWGRPRAGSAGPPRSAPTAPDDDPEFLRGLGRSNQEHDRLLSQWEQDLRRREEQLRDGPPATDEPPATP